MSSSPEERGLSARLVARARLLIALFPSDAAYVRAVFAALLGREPEAAALAHYTGILRQRSATRADVYQDILAAATRQRHAAAALDAPKVWLRTLLKLGIAGEERRLTRARPDLGAQERRIYAIYHAVLRRAPDATGLATCLDDLRSGKTTYAELLRLLSSSAEFSERQGLRTQPRRLLRLYLMVAARYLGIMARRPWPLDVNAFLAAAYEVLLGRAVDEGGRQIYQAHLSKGSLSPLGVIDGIIDSPEFKRRHGLPIAPLDAIHHARMQLFETLLPPANEIVDLGGAAHNDPRGALLLMGYPHHAARITILDLPPPERIGGVHAAEHVQEYRTPEGTIIRYLYRSMSELDPIPDASVDLVVSGESIEHISEAEAERVCAEAFRILRSGGHFCLDTPNARLTRLQMPDSFIHPEHQKEYDPDEIRSMLVRRGFEIVDAAGIVPMPESLRTRRFDLTEMTRNIGLSGNPDEGYMFFFNARKP